jgi:hypothetical protein
MKNLIIALFTVVLAVSLASAQSSDVIEITASVGDLLLVEAGDGMEFGTLSTGVTYTLNTSGFLAPANVDGDVEGVPGSWNITGTANTAVAVTLLLTDRLVGGDGAPLSVSYSSQSAGWNYEGDATATQQLFDPRVGTTIPLGTDGVATVFLGATVAVPQFAAGDYTGTVALNAAYTGL